MSERCINKPQDRYLLCPLPIQYSYGKSLFTKNGPWFPQLCWIECSPPGHLPPPISELINHQPSLINYIPIYILYYIILYCIILYYTYISPYEWINWRWNGEWTEWNTYPKKTLWMDWLEENYTDTIDVFYQQIQWFPAYLPLKQLWHTRNPSVSTIG
jgi:hypothetical protein